MKKLLALFSRRNQKTPITIVSGLPRSGTSMMMKMLEAGGIAPLTDGIRASDKDNPKGYYEFERVKRLNDGDTAWLPEAQGKSVKIISALLIRLPDDYVYKTIFMTRNISEIVASQRKMLIRRGEDPDTINDQEIEMLFQKHLQKTYQWIDRQKNMSCLKINYNDLLATPLPHLAKIHAFLDNVPDVQRMSGIIDPALYRQRDPTHESAD